MVETIKKVLANVVQHFTESEKALARANIGAAAVEDITTDAVKYTPQTLTDAQKDQGRMNLDAAKNVLASSSNNGQMSSTDKTKLDGIQAGAEANVQADWNQSNAAADDYIKNKPENLVQDANYVHTDNNFTTAEKTKLAGIEAGAEVNVQPDWNQADSSADDYIKNKPADLVQDANYVHTDNNFTSSEKTKLAGIENGATKVLIPNNPSQPQPLTLDSYNLHFHWGSGLSCYTPTGGVPQLIVDPSITTKLAGIEDGAEVNVQADWSQTNTSADDYIKNKPSNLVQDASYVHTDNNFTTTLKDKLDGIASGAEVNVQSDWNQTNSAADDYIKNKPSNLVQDASYVHTDNNFTTALKDKLDGIAAGAEVNVQSDWNQSNSSADDYIKNKPVVDQSYSASSANAQSGTAVAEAIASVDTSLFEALYGSTTYADIVQAIADKKIVYCRVSAYTATSSRMAFLAYIGIGSTGKIEFQYYRSNGDPTGNDSVFVYAVDANNNWTTTERAVEKIQANWTESNSSAVSYIKNKPTNLVQDASYVHTDNNFTTTLKDKLDGIESGAEVNDITDVQVNGVSVVTNKVANISLPTPVTEVYLAEYGTATVSEISAAKTAGKLVYTLIPGTYYPTVAYLRETTRNGASANFASPASDSGSFKVASVTSSGTWSNETLNLAKTSDLSPNKIVFVTTNDTYATVDGYRQAGYEVILKYSSSGSDLFQYFRLSQYNPDGSMEFECIRSGSGYIIAYKYGLNTNGVWTRTDTSVSQYTGVQIDGVGRNLHLNQNNYIQTNFPGGLWTADMAQNNIFYRLSGGEFAGAYYLAARYKTDGTYELGLSYSGSGSSGTITFIGTETIVALDNTVTTKQAAYIGETEYYTVSTRFGGNASTAFDPTRHKAIYYSGFANIGPASDVKIAIWNDNGTIKIGFTNIEVGKVGATN